VLLMVLMFGAEAVRQRRALITGLTVFAQILLLSAIIPSIFGLFSGLLRRLFEEWRYRPRLEVEFIPDENGFCTEGTWNEGDKSFPRFTWGSRTKYGEARRLAMQSYLVKLEEVHPSGTTATPFSFSDNLVLPWPLGDYRPRDITRGIDQFFDVLGVLNNRLGWWAHLQRKFH
jgi:hypothetical protein